MELRYCILSKIQIYRGAIKHDIILHCNPPPPPSLKPRLPLPCRVVTRYMGSWIKDQKLTKKGEGRDHSLGIWHTNRVIGISSVLSESGIRLP